MHGSGADSDPIVNAEVDSMGGVFEGGVGIDNKTSPQRLAIEEVQAELRQEYGVLDEKRRELEFLEKGGDPLDFKLGSAASLSVQSTSLTDQHADQLVTSEAKVSFAITASPHGDSVESSGRLGAPQFCEPNSADNLMLFDGENEFIEGGRSSRHPGRSSLTPSKQSSKLDRCQNVKDLGDSAVFGVSRKAYKRSRYRPRPKGDGARSNSTNVMLDRGGHDTSLPLQHFSKDAKGPFSDEEKPMDQNSSLNMTQPTSPNGCMTVKTLPCDTQLALEVDGVKAAESTTYMKKDDLIDTALEASGCRGFLDNQDAQNSLTGIEEMPIQEGHERPQLSPGKEVAGSAGQEGQLCTTAAGLENEDTSSQINAFSSRMSDKKGIPNDPQSSGATLGTKGLDSESSYTRIIHGVDRNNDSEMCTDPKHLDSNGDLKEQPVPEGTPLVESNVKEEREVKADDSCGLTTERCHSGNRNHRSDFVDISEETIVCSESNLQTEVKDKITIEGVEAVAPSTSETEKKPSTNICDSSNSSKGSACVVGRQGSTESRIPEPPDHASLCGVSNLAPETQASGISFKLAAKADEALILKEAQIIEAKRKRIAELSSLTFPVENRRRSHWSYVLEEMVWLANDFAQERLWKMTAAAQMCHRVAFIARSRLQEQNSSWKLKKIANLMAKAGMDFWKSVEGKSKKLDLPIPRKDQALAIREYAMRFLKYNDSDVPQLLAEAPVTPERASDAGIIDVSHEDHLREENLFYTIPLGAMVAYRMSIESHVLHREFQTRSSMHEEIETSACDAVPDFGYQDYAFEEDEGETSPYDMSVNKSSSFSQKKKKIHIKAYRPYDVRGDVPFMSRAENKLGTHQLGKLPASNLNVSVPTKRMRTATRQRVLSPYRATTSGYAQLPIKTDASSGDTSSFQDDQTTLHGGFHMPNSVEVESVSNFEKHLPFDSAEVSKPKKKKKAKFPGPTYEQRWQVDSNFQNDQRDHSRKRLESHQLDSNASNGLFGQHIAKKPKLMRQSLENSFENVGPVGGFVPSPAASQMSNMSNPNKIMRMFSGRDQSRRAKNLKMPSGQSGSGTPWSLFEDQALVVLVHDMGPNWELVSDAFNSTLQFKCIYRKPKECKERHKVLMDRSGDGADSADDSGSSQPYPSTLPGIPKGSARQLFQRLQGPMEEDTLRSHFEKMITIGQKYLLRKTQGYKHDPRQLQQPHDSHSHALSQICPNNLNGGPILTPLDLCDAPSPSPDYHSVAFQGPPRSSGLSVASQGSLNSVLPTPGANSTVQAPPNMITGNNFPSSSSPHASARDSRYVAPRCASLPADEQQRLQQYNQMRNMQSNAPGIVAATDRVGVRTMPPNGNNSMGMLGGVNRGIPVSRPGFPGSMLSSSGMVMPPNTMNMNSGVRPREALHVMRPPQNQEAQRQMMVPELQLQASQGNSQVVAPFGGLGSSFVNQSASPVTAYPLHHPQQPLVLSGPHLPNNHATNSQHQAYAIRLAKERHLQQQRLLQQQQQFSHPQPPQLNNSPKTATSQSSSPPVSVSPLTSPTSHQTHGIARTAQTTQMSKQRPRQTGQLQQAGRQRQQSQAKLLKGVGRGNNLVIPQNLQQIDRSLVNGLPNEKAEQPTHLMQGQQGLYSASAAHRPVQLTKQAVAPRASSQLQPKVYSGQIPPSAKHLKSSNLDNSNQGPGSSPASDTNSSQQSAPSSVMGKLMNQNQATTVQRVLQQSHSDLSKKLLQPGEPQAMCKTSQLGAASTSMPPDCNDAAPKVPDVTESSFDGTPPATSAGGESVDHGVIHKQISGNLSPTGSESSVGWHQKSSQLQPPSSVTQPRSQAQAQVLQAGNSSSSFARPNDCRHD